MILTKRVKKKFNSDKPENLKQQKFDVAHPKLVN